jgi:hypothetical protein
MEANQSKAKVGQVCFDRSIENELDMQPFSYAYECNFMFRQNVKQNIFNISRSFIFQSLRAGNTETNYPFVQCHGQRP